MIHGCQRRVQAKPGWRLPDGWQHVFGKNASYACEGEGEREERIRRVFGLQTVPREFFDVRIERLIVEVDEAGGAGGHDVSMSTPPKGGRSRSYPPSEE